MFCWDVMVELADLTLTASPDHRDLKGELTFTMVPSEATRTVRPGPPTTWPITGRVDPGSNAVWLAPPPPAPRTAIGPVFEAKPLGAVFSAARNELAGQFRNPRMPGTTDASAPYFLFVRAGNGADAAAAVARLQSFASHAAETAIPPRGRNGGSPPSDADLLKWIAPYEEEFGKSAGAGGVGQIFERMMPIFADAAFQPVFGQPYDRIDVGTLASAIRRFNDPKFAREHAYLQYAVPPSPSKLVAVGAMRTIDAWKDEMLARFRSGTPVASAFDDLAATQKAMQETVVYAFPSARKKTDEEIEQLRGTLSGSSVGANADAAIAAAAGLDGAKKLASWTKDNAAMLARLSPAERQAAQTKVDAKLDEILTSLLEPETAKLASLGTGESAVRAGVAWNKALADRFAFGAARPPYAAAVAKLASRREADIAAGSPQILQGIQACKTPEEVDAILAGDLGVPGDERTKPYAAIADAAAKRRQKIEEERILALFSPEERADMDRPGHIDLKRAKERPPTAEEVRLAMLRGWGHGTEKMIDAHRCRYVDLTSSKVMFIPFPVILTFSQENLISADPIEESSEYQCTFTILIQMAAADDNMVVNFDEVVRKQSATTMQLVNSLFVGMSTEPQTKVLHLTEHGWEIPELMEAGAVQGALEHWLHVR